MMPRPSVLLAQLRRAQPRTTPNSFIADPKRFQSTKEPSAHTQFYKTFGRPIAKVFLMAVFTYQLVYYGWAKLEQEEIKDGRNAEIHKLESQVQSLQGAARGSKKAT